MTHKLVKLKKQLLITKSILLQNFTARLKEENLAIETDIDDFEEKQTFMIN